MAAREMLLILKLNSMIDHDIFFNLENKYIDLSIKSTH